MHVLIGDQKVDLTQGSNGRLQATFTATENTNSVLIPSDCIGTLNVNDIQLEQGSQATSFVEPAVDSEDISGIFKDLRDLRIDIKDTEEGLSHQITINQEGLEQLISDTEGRLNSRITITADTWQGELSDTERELSNQITATAGLWQRKLTDTERGLQSAIQSKADSLITLIEDTDSKNFSKTEQLVNGLQTTVQGDLKSQRTQLENLISSSIESATGSRSTIWQTLNSHGSQISNAQGDINRVEQTVSGYSRRLSDVEGNYSSIEQTVSGLNTEVNGYYGGVQSRFRQLEGLIDARVTRKDVEGIIQNSGDNIWLAIGNRVQSVAGNATMSGSEIMSEINLQANRQIFRVSDNRLMITEDTTYISDATIKSSHIASLNADKITAGTLDAGKVRVINLDANNITANKTSFVQSAWNSIDSSIRIDGDGLLSTASDGSQVYIQNGIMGAKDTDGRSIGQIGYVNDNGSPTFTIRTTWGSSFAIKQTFYDSYTKTTKNKRALDMYTTDDGYSETIIRMSRIVILGDAHVSFHFRHAINGNDQNRLMINGAESVSLRANDSTVFAVSNNGNASSASLYTNLNMQGYTVRNTSDIRLKRDVVNDEIDSLSALMKWQHAGFNYTNPDMNQERQFGVIAQSAPDIAFADEDGYLQVSLNKQVNMTSHALQQHVIKTNDEITRLKAQIASLQDELALLKGDRR